MAIVEDLEKLQHEIAAEPLPRSKDLWTGAGVAIRRPSDSPPPGDGFRPPPRLVVSDHALELSWVFDRLGRAFFAAGLIDGNSKVEFFGRLANAAGRSLDMTPGSSAKDLCGALLFEARMMAAEIERGIFQVLPVARNGEIADDDKRGGTLH